MHRHEARGDGLLCLRTPLPTHARLLACVLPLLHHLQNKECPLGDRCSYAHVSALGAHMPGPCCAAACMLRAQPVTQLL
jgi:hypothetical protein